MNSLSYLDDIKNEYLLNSEDLADICDKLAYIARDNKEDDTDRKSTRLNSSHP